MAALLLRYGISVTTIRDFPLVSCSILALPRIRTLPLPLAYASMTPSRPTICPPVGKSGAGIILRSLSSGISGSSMTAHSAFTTSLSNEAEDSAVLDSSNHEGCTHRRLCGGMFVAMPTAIPVAPFRRRQGTRAGSNVGSSEEASKLGT
eukprot:scaffold1938_cov399-Prasinococcus_capsulatus_cf.AAC.23